MADATFDGDNLVITLPVGETLVDTEVDIYSAWKRFLLADPLNRRFPPAFRTAAGDPLTPGIDAGGYFFIRNDLGWRIRPAEADATVLLTSNLVPQDSSLPILIPTLGTFRVLVAGLQPITQAVDTLLAQQQETLYDGIISIDLINGVAGTAFPVGTKSTPVNNVTDARTIANTRGLRQYDIRGSITLDQSYDDWTFKGVGSAQSDEINLGGFSVSDSLFTSLTLRGSTSGASQINARDCVLNAVTGVGGQFKDCTFIGNIGLRAPNSFMFDCAAGGFAGATLDLNGAGNVVAGRNITGLWTISNALAGVPFPSIVSLNIADAEIVLDANNIGSVIEVNGQGRVTDNTSVADIIGVVSPVELHLVHQMQSGNVTVSLDDRTVTVLDTDLTTLAVFDISVDKRTRTRTS